VVVLLEDGDSPLFGRILYPPRIGLATSQTHDSIVLSLQIRRPCYTTSNIGPVIEILHFNSLPVATFLLPRLIRRIYKM
jgi:hypothetical protein